MRFWMIGGMDPWMRQVVGFGDHFIRWRNFGGKCWAPHCNHWGICGIDVQVCEPTRPVLKLLWAVLVLLALLHNFID